MKRILFVDDEPFVLDALRALLRPRRDRWEMAFAPSGEAALARMEHERFDVVVSDMRMPGMDGAELLRRVQRDHAHTVRIVLSGFAELELALRTVPVAHQFLVKPCEPDVLENVIDRACALQSVVHAPAVERLVAGLGGLPAAPQLHLRLTAALAAGRGADDEAAEVLDEDPFVRANVLHLANSALLGLDHEVASVQDAVHHLGTNMLKHLALAVDVFGVPPPGAGPALCLHRMQRHALYVGTLARTLAGGDRRLAEDAFIAGALHDAGKLLLLQADPERFADVRDRAVAERRAAHAIEQEACGTTHAELGAHLLAAWGLPYPVVEAVANHHAPARVPQHGPDPLTLVHVANVLAHEQMAAFGEDEVFVPLDDAWIEARGLRGSLEPWRAAAHALVGATRTAHWRPERHAA